MANESDVKLRAILETAVEGIVTINELGIVSSFNPASERLFGYDEEEVIGENVSMLMPSPYQEQHDSYLAGYLESGLKNVIGIGRDVVGRRKDGSTFPMYLSVGEFRLNNQRYFTGIVRDKSDENRIQRSLEHSEAKMRAIFDTIIEGIVTIDKQGTIKSLNPAAVLMFGYEAEEIIGQNVNVLAPPPFRNEHDTYLSKYVQTGERKIIGVGREVIGQRKDGTTFPMYLSVGEMWIDGEQYFTGIVRDLTEEKRVQERETEIGRILDSSLDEIYIFDAESLRFIQVNKGARENNGYTLEEFRELSPLNLKTELTEAQLRKLLEPLRTGEQEQVVFETVHQRKDGSLYSVEIHLQLSYYDSHRAFVAIALDTTQRKATEKVLLQSERLAAIGEVVSGVAHESRNALQRIQANVEMAQIDAEGNDDVMYYLAKIENASNDLQLLLEEVRNYAAPLSLDRELASVASVWRSAWSNVASLRESRDVTLNEEICTPETKCDIDPFRMEQVFRNLFENSLAACPDPVQIEIGCYRIDGEDALRVHFRDNGPGLDPEQRANVFDAFYTTKKGGTGLGMAITKRILEAHGGSISVAAGACGAEFVIVLPQPFFSSPKPPTQSPLATR